MTRPTLLLAATSLGLVSGVAIGWVLATTKGDRPELSVLARDVGTPALDRDLPAGASVAQVDREGAEPSDADANATRREVAAPAPNVNNASRELATSTIVSDRALRRWAEEEIVRGWSRLRRDPLPPEKLAYGLVQFEQQLANSPGAIGALIAKAATEREESLALGTAAQLLDRMEGGDAVDSSFVRDPARLATLFPRTFQAGTVDGLGFLRRSAGPPPRIEDGVTIVFPAGVHDTSLEPSLRSARPFPRDLVIAGAGIDQTILRFDELHATGSVQNLTLRDFTFWNDGSLFDLRSGTRATLTLERVRVVGFDCGAGSCSALNLDATVLRATDCIFAGGFGRHPDYSYLFDVRTDALLARFERCRFERLAFWHSTPHDEWWIHFADCTFDQITAARGTAEALPPNIEFVGGAPHFIDRPAPGERPTARDLAELFPQWHDWRERLR